MTTQIIGTGSYLPKKVINNEYLSSIVDTNDEWITTRTGIKERRMVQEEEGTAYMGAQAAEEALKDAGIKAEEIDLILLATMSPDAMLPNSACEIQTIIGAKNAVCMDINAACSGFLFALCTAHGYIKSGMYKTALVIGSETVTRMLDWQDRGTCILFGDGAGACVVKEGNTGIIDWVLHSDGTKGQVLTNKNQYIEMNGQEVFRFAVKSVPQCIEELFEKTGTKAEDIACFVLHQANIRIIKSVAQRVGAELEKFPCNLSWYGNTSAASVPILLDELNKSGKLKAGDKIVLSGFGGGLTWGAVLLEW